MEEIPDVLCINCENMIEISKLDVHSRVCYSYSNEVKKFENTPYMSYINFRIIKLKSSIEALVYFSKIGQIYLQDLVTKANEIVFIQSYSIESIDQATAILSQIRKISGSLPAKYFVYSERLKVLVSNKIYHILDELSKDSEKHKRKQILIQMSQYRLERKTMDHIRNKSEFKNNFEGSDDAYSMGGGSLSRESFGGTPFQLSEVEPERSSKNDLFSHDELKKYFYSKCLIVKLGFPSRHPAQYIQINDLFTKVLNDQMPINQWEKFIKEEFSHPERWVNLNVIPNHDKYKY